MKNQRVCIFDIRFECRMSFPVRAVQRNKAALEKRAKLANNICPICWMPLSIGEGRVADCWRAVQMAFKGKPAFSVRNPNGIGDVSRPVKAFGINPLTGSTQANCEQCHYVHFSMFGDHSDLNNLWYGCEFFQKIPMRNNEAEPTKLDAFYSGIREDRSIFSVAVLNPKFNGYIVNALSDVNSNWNTITILAVKMFRFFPGCTDCNSHMTISKLIETLFDQLFPSDAYISRFPAPAAPVQNPPIYQRPKNKFRKSRKKKEFDVEEMIHYLMLSGMLKADGDVHSDTFNFSIADEGRKKTWTLKYIIMWCALQIIFCQWNIKQTAMSIGHHRNYMFFGTMDFYMSLWFYALHCLGPTIISSGKDLTIMKKEPLEYTFQDDKETLAESMVPYTNKNPLEFEEFHYYYTSVFPFFLTKYYPDEKRHSSLSLSVFSLGDGPDFDVSSSTLVGLEHPDILLNAVRNNLGLVYEKVFTAWGNYVSTFSAMIHNDFAIPSDEDLVLSVLRTKIGLFFIKPSEIIAKRGVKERLNLDIDTFIDHQSPYWYWFHFKNITMPQIRRLCREYDRETLQGQASPHFKPDRVVCITLWRRWFQLFDARVRALGASAERQPVVRGLLELRSRMIADRLGMQTPL